ncbi:tyrosine-type recombinase/integrase [Pseudorhodoplanes sp.]|uniref:tyrosine-type recombinase/integrase n=1 Tax=Pseudorhodoplanes sp. TaxID=1934341 RepID=UPI002C941E21|nr:tyrosine-type recombinase/integrase [Pseudorhodoplanes sp.]HWV40550.1 tyrosine-type recombinase/integrase [Pseudorhodoplanes sp.]
MKPVRPIKRDGVWYLIRRVPKRFEHLDRRKLVRISTNIRVADDPRSARAILVVDELNRNLEAYWNGLSNGGSAEARSRYDAARARARSLGFDYVLAQDLPSRGLAEVLARLRALEEKGALEDRQTVEALLGGVERPRLRLSDLVAEYETQMRAAMSDMSPDQKRQRHNFITSAVQCAIKAMGDKNLDQITRDNALDLREFWQNRVTKEGIAISSANKKIAVMSSMWRVVNEARRLNLEPVFSRLRIAGKVDHSRPPFPPDFVQRSLLAPGALDTLNPEARRVIFLMVETGMRPSEAVNLTAETIILDGDIPHVQVRPDGRRMKTLQSQRDIPLVGVALDAMQMQPDGFPRYRDKSTSLSNLVNKVLETRKLLPTPQHSMYSLRHTFEDRLSAVEAPDKLIAALMGHKFQRPKYGAGPTLDQKVRWLKRIAFRPPSKV